MAKTRQQKEQTVTTLSDKLSRAKSVVFANFRGLSMKQLSELRNKLESQEAEFTVTKNTLLNLASQKAQLPELPDNIQKEPTATLFSFEDEILPIKTMVNAFKDAQKGQVKGGFLDKNFLDALTINRLANLPTKQELQAKVVGSLSSPLYGIVGVLQANLRNLVYALDQIREQRR